MKQRHRGGALNIGNVLQSTVQQEIEQSKIAQQAASAKEGVDQLATAIPDAVQGAVRTIEGKLETQKQAIKDIVEQAKQNLRTDNAAQEASAAKEGLNQLSRTLPTSLQETINTISQKLESQKEAINAKLKDHTDSVMQMVRSELQTDAAPAAAAAAAPPAPAAPADADAPTSQGGFRRRSRSRAHAKKISRRGINQMASRRGSRRSTRRRAGSRKARKASRKASRK